MLTFGLVRSLHTLGVPVINYGDVQNVYLIREINRPSTKQLLNNFWGQFFRKA